MKIRTSRNCRYLLQRLWIIVDQFVYGVWTVLRRGLCRRRSLKYKIEVATASTTQRLWVQSSDANSHTNVLYLVSSNVKQFMLSSGRQEVKSLATYWSFTICHLSQDVSLVGPTLSIPLARCSVATLSKFAKLSGNGDKLLQQVA